MSHLDLGTIHELLDGEIPSSRLAPIQAHLASCAECRTLLAEERALADGVDELISAIEVPNVAPQGAAPPAAAPRRGRRLRDLAWAATVVIAAGLGYALRGPAGTIIQHDTVTVAAKPDLPNDQPATPTQPTVHARAPISAKGRVAQPAPTAVAAVPPADARNLIGQRSDSAMAMVAQTVSGGTPVVGAATTVVPRDAVRTSQTVAVAAPPAKDSVGRIDSTRATAAEARPLAAGGGGGRGGRGGGRSTPIDSISLADAMKRLGGRIMRIDSIEPIRYQVQEPYVYVLYPGGVRLRQRLIDGTIQFEVFVPGASVDSIAKVRAKVHE
ncbi:MAG: zf-HC2 domain-containing protein [Gemmatimonadota bacterium]